MIKFCMLPVTSTAAMALCFHMHEKVWHIYANTIKFYVILPKLQYKAENQENENSHTNTSGKPSRMHCKYTQPSQTLNMVASKNTIN